MSERPSSSNCCRKHWRFCWAGGKGWREGLWARVGTRDTGCGLHCRLGLGRLPRPPGSSLSSDGVDPPAPSLGPPPLSPAPRDRTTVSRLAHWDVRQGCPGHSPRPRACCPRHCPAQVSSGKGAPTWPWPEGLPVGRLDRRDEETEKADDRRKLSPVGSSQHSWKRRWEGPGSKEASECTMWGVPHAEGQSVGQRSSEGVS